MLNHNGRQIDYDGTQYKKLIRDGYKLDNDGLRLIIDETFTGDRDVRRPIGRPKGTTANVPNTEKVKNPETGRFFIKNWCCIQKTIKEILIQ